VSLGEHSIPAGLPRCCGFLWRSPLDDHSLGHDGRIVTRDAGQEGPPAGKASVVLAKDRLVGPMPRYPVELGNVLTARRRSPGVGVVGERFDVTASTANLPFSRQPCRTDNGRTVTPPAIGDTLLPAPAGDGRQVDVGRVTWRTLTMPNTSSGLMAFRSTARTLAASSYAPTLTRAT
jgi:hypothetical protein